MVNILPQSAVVFWRLEVPTLARIETVAFWVMMPSSFTEEIERPYKIGDVSSHDVHKMKMILEEERKTKCDR
jgi:hypothetical protein